MSQQVYMNRELSWLKFNERVLEEAENKKVPLCERLTFASIYQSNLDEFFRVRVGSLVDQMLLGGKIRDNKTKMTAKEQIEEVLHQVMKLNRRKDAVYDAIMGQLEDYGVRLVDFRKISKKESEYLEKYFLSEIAPVISPTIVGKRQPFPFLKNNEIYAVVVLQTKSGKEKLGIIPCSNTGFKRLVELPTAGTYMLAEELILHYIPEVFERYNIKAKSLIRVTRNADIDADALYDEDLDYRDFMAELIKRRKKLAPVRLELTREMDGEIVDVLCDYLELDSDYVFQVQAPLDLSFVFEIQDTLRKTPELFYEKRVPQKSSQFRDGEPVFPQIREKDKLLSYPYESMKPFLNFLREAANDKEVISIKMTLYRVAKHSKIVEYLIDAAENGKEVLVLVELKARFDEENNIEWSRRLEDAGCRVIYGLDGLKVHSKLCLITYKNEKGIQYISQIGTGNYNEKTSRLYTDLSLMTSKYEIGEEINGVFNHLCLGETENHTDLLMVAPHCMISHIFKYIDEQIELAKQGKEAYIGFKCNSVTSKKMIDKLIEASQAGVQIDMVVRGICCIIPGVEEATENIRVLSIVGRYLEHSRIYIFVKNNPTVYISSADLMTRNLERRVEVAAPVLDEKLKHKLLTMFDCMLRDNVKAYVMNADGSYAHMSRRGKTAVGAQKTFCQEAIKAAKEEEVVWKGRRFVPIWAVDEENQDA